jgi:uncharacterized protein
MYSLVETMTMLKPKILFFHGLDSSKESTKFYAIDSDHKFCVTVDYRALSFQSVYGFYQDLIETLKPTLMIGHSLGGYWALKMSLWSKIPAIIANPSLSPSFRDDYPAICEEDLEHDILQLAYLELDDEILDMHAVQAQLEPYMQVAAVAGGHHRLARPENINVLIEQMQILQQP